jgi:hypothetical protein
MLISFLTLITQFSFQIVFQVGNTEWYDKNQTTRTILNDFGIFRFKDKPYYEIILGFAPDVLIFLSSVLLFFLLLVKRIYDERNRKLKKIETPIYKGRVVRN